MSQEPLPHSLEREVVIRASRADVFRFFTDSTRWASWWGSGSTIDPRPRGKIHIRYPNGVEAGGEVLAIEPPHRIVFSFGYASGAPLPLGASRVTIALGHDPVGTRLSLRHDFDDAAARDQHVQGWRYQLALFANVAADHLNAAAAERADAWFAAWSEPDGERREALLASAVAPGVRFRDRWSCVDGLVDLRPHLAAVHQVMPGMRLERQGAVRHCQGTLLADWVARGADGATRGSGSNVFTLDAEGRIVDVVGLWAAPAG